MSEPTVRTGLLDPGEQLWLGERPMTVAWRKGTAAAPVLKLDGVDDREHARALVGTEILAPRAAIGPLPPGEYLIDDLVGMEVADGGRRIGRVADVVVLPSVEALEVEVEGGEPLLVPLVRDAIRSIEPGRGVIDVDCGYLAEEPDRGN